MIEAAGENLLFRITKIREELSDVTSFLASVTNIEKVGNKRLPRNTRIVIYRSILRMIELQKELADLEVQLGSNLDIEFEQLETNQEHWRELALKQNKKTHTHK